MATGKIVETALLTADFFLVPKQSLGTES